jgi:hypothetical protein
MTTFDGEGITPALTLLTATGARPKAWAICERLMQAQKFDGNGIVHWVIVDDGPEPQPITFDRFGWSVEVIRPTPYWQNGQNTQARNLAAGLAVIPDNHRVVIIEDDDHYAPGYLSAVLEWLDHAELVGESHARYYHIGRQVWKHCGNDQHASLCSTAVRGSALKLLREIVQQHHKFIDIELWRQFTGPKHLQKTDLCVGIKGLPGRGGIGAGHRMTGTLDQHRETLRSWLGDAADLYR